MNPTAKLMGGKEMIKVIKDIAKKFPDDVAKAMFQEAQVEVTEMKKRCPVDVSPNAPHPGNLRASIHAERPERNGRTLIQIFATGVQAPYAIYVHEDPDAHHEIGEWKFMESVINESAPYFLQRIGTRVSFNKHKDAASYLSDKGGED
jgi:hypothetical protein